MQPQHSRASVTLSTAPGNKSSPKPLRLRITPHFRAGDILLRCSCGRLSSSPPLHAIETRGRRLLPPSLVNLQVTAQWNSTEENEGIVTTCSPHLPVKSEILLNILSVNICEFDKPTVYSGSRCESSMHANCQRRVQLWKKTGKFEGWDKTWMVGGRMHNPFEDMISYW